MLRNQLLARVARSIPGLSFTGGAQQIDRERLCEEDYSGYALLPVFAGALAPFVDQAPDLVGMCVAGLRAAFWYCWNNQWPCCGEGDRGDACWQRAMIIAQMLFESDVIEAAKERLLPELRQYDFLTAGGQCPDVPLPGQITTAV
jgi:hypothetical protein